MILWLIFGLMTAAAVFAVIWPLVRQRGAEHLGSDIEVYRDQLDEVDRDLAAGLVGKTEAQAARIEISRRLLAAADANQTAPAPTNPAAAVWRRRVVVFISLILLPAGAAGLYLQIGSPNLASMAIAAQQNAGSSPEASIAALVAKAEAQLQRNPKDGRGWEVLAPVYMRLGRYTDSVNAWRNVIVLLGQNADREASLGESLMAEANGVVTADAKAAFVRAVTLDNTTVSARYYLGVAAEQDGDHAKAAKIFRDLIAEAPAGAHWVADVRKALARVEGKAPATPSGPTPAQMDAAAKEPPAKQDSMVQGMVDRLAARLKADGSDVDGWVRLVRSYKVLGEQEKMKAAIADGQRALAGDKDKRQRLDAAVKAIEEGKAVPDTEAPPPASAASSAAPPQHQEAQISGMVDKLAARLQKSGDDPGGWLMLTRSYITLGEKQKAAAAIASARAAMGADPIKVAQFNQALKQFKIDDQGNVAPAAAAPATPAPAQAPPPAGAPDVKNNEMIRGMVTRLAERLKQDGSDVDGWIQLVRSYVVLGERDKAKAAVADARRAVSGDAAKRQRLDDFVKTLGLDG
jgi:cytochrome c-type biogenesis protein CcmH